MKKITMEYPGGLTLSDEAVEAVIKQCCFTNYKANEPCWGELAVGYVEDREDAYEFTFCEGHANYAEDEYIYIPEPEQEEAKYENLQRTK